VFFNEIALCVIKMSLAEKDKRDLKFCVKTNDTALVDFYELICTYMLV